MNMENFIDLPHSKAQTGHSLGAKEEPMGGLGTHSIHTIWFTFLILKKKKSVNPVDQIQESDCWLVIVTSNHNYAANIFIITCCTVRLLPWSNLAVTNTTLIFHSVFSLT